MIPSTRITIFPNGGSRIDGMEGNEAMNPKPEKLQEVTLEPIKPLFSLRRLAEYFDCYTEDGKPATDTILEWWHSGRIPRRT